MGEDVMTNLPEALIRAVDRGGAVLFVGAGVSRASGIPTAADLSNTLARDAAYPETYPHDLIDISEYYEARFGRTVLLSKLRSLMPTDARPTEGHRRMAALAGKLPLIITTNYDTLVESAYREAGRTLRVVRETDGLANVKSDEPTLIKLHGDLDRDVVITRADYLRFLANTLRGLTASYLRAKLANSAFLFVGYSLLDYNFVALFDAVKRELGDMMPRSFAVMPSPDLVYSEIWRKRGVELIDATSDDFFVSLASVLSRRSESKVFVAHSSEDAPTAELLRSTLQANGVRVRMPRDVAAGEPIDAAVSDAILSSRAVVFLLSRATENSESVRKDLALAESAGVRIIPILLEQCELPAELGTRVYLDARSDSSGAVDQLISLLRDISANSGDQFEYDSTPLAGQGESLHRFTSAEQLGQEPRPLFVGRENLLKAGIALGARAAANNCAINALVFGFPGTGKTSFAHALAHSLNTAGLPYSLLWMPCGRYATSLGPSEVRERLQDADRFLAQSEPIMVVFDEIDAVSPDRQDTRSASTVAHWTLDALRQMNVQSRPRLVLAITNFPRNVEPALLGEFGLRFYLPLPSIDEAVALLELAGVRHPAEVAQEYALLCADHSSSFTGRGLHHAVRDVRILMGEKLDDLSPKKIAELLFGLGSLVDDETIERYVRDNRGAITAAEVVASLGFRIAG
jgi:thymidylate kinase